MDLTDALAIAKQIADALEAAARAGHCPVSKQVTVEGGAGSPVWTSDSKRLAFASDSGTGVSNLWLTKADGSGTPTRLTTSPKDQQPYSWDSTGKFLADTESRPNTARDVMVLPVEGDASRG